MPKQSSNAYDPTGFSIKKVLEEVEANVKIEGDPGDLTLDELSLRAQKLGKLSACIQKLCKGAKEEDQIKLFNAAIAAEKAAIFYIGKFHEIVKSVDASLTASLEQVAKKLAK